MDRELIDFIREDLKELKADVKLLLADKNKRLGIQITTSFLFSLVFALIMAFIGHH